MKEHLDQLIEELELSKEDLEKKEGLLHLQLDDNLKLTFKKLEPFGFSVSSSIADRPEMKLEEIYTTVMTGNLFGSATGGAVIGLDSEGKNFTLELEIPQQVNYREFFSHIESFINSLEFWQGEIEKHVKSAEDNSNLLY